MKVFWLLTVWTLVAVSSVFAQARSVHIVTPKPRLVSGEQVQLSAVARDANAAASTGDSFQWTSTDNRIVSVDSNGVVTAQALGIAEVFASTGGARGNVRLQVLPLRIDVTPPSGRVIVGERVEFRAVARDIQEGEIPNVAFQWEVLGSGGFRTQAAQIDRNGVLAGSAVGRFTVRAFVSYPAGPGQFVGQFFGAAAVEIRPPSDFRLTRLLSSVEVLPSVSLRTAPRNVPITANDAGQIAFVASLDGVTTGLLLYDNGRFDLLTSTGTSGPLPRTTINNFGRPVLNNHGDVLTGVGLAGWGDALVLASRAGPSFLMINGQTGDGFEQMCCFWPYALNDAREIVFGAHFQRPDSSERRRGVFLRSDHGLEMVWSLEDPLPGFTGSSSVDQVGIDRAGTVYFKASSGASHAIYRRERLFPLARVVGTGDSFAGSTVRQIHNLGVAGDGTLAYILDVASGQQYLVRVVAGRLESVPLRNPGSMMTAANNGGVTFMGDAGRGWGIYRWRGNSLGLVAAPGRPAPNGEPIRAVESAAMTGQGRVFAQVRTAESDLAVIEPGAARPLLFQAGDRINVAANFAIQGFVAGSRAGPPHLLMGGQPGSLFELSPRGPVPRLVAGDRLPNGTTFTGAWFVQENAASGVYFAPSDDGSTYRIGRGGRIETVFQSGTRFDDGVSLWGSRPLAVNSQGLVLLSGGTDRNHERLFLLDNTRVRVLAFSVGAPPWQTPAPAGGTIHSWNQAAIDERGRVMIFLNVRDGPSGLFLFQDGRWQPAALINSTQAGGQTIASVHTIKAVGDRFFAVFGLRGFGSVLAEYQNQQWIPLVSPGDFAPNGMEINSIGPFDVNRQGELVFMVFFNGGMSGILLRTIRGLDLIHQNIDPTEAGDFLLSVTDVALAEDRRVYFIGLDLANRTFVYVAQPLF